MAKTRFKHYVISPKTLKRRFTEPLLYAQVKSIKEGQCRLAVKRNITLTDVKKSYNFTPITEREFEMSQVP